MLMGVLSGVTGGVKSDSNFEFTLKLPINVVSLFDSLPTLFMSLIGTSSSIALLKKNKIKVRHTFSKCKGQKISMSSEADRES